MGRRSTKWGAITLVGTLAGTATLIEPSRGHEPQTVVIAEVMASNTATIFDEDHDTADWIELWNRSSAEVDLAGWTLSDGGAGDAEDRWQFPPLVLAPDQRIVVFASGKADRHGLHTNFEVSAGGEHLTLRDATGSKVDEQRTPPMGANASYGIDSSHQRLSMLQSPTPGLANTATRPAAAGKPTLSQAGHYFDRPLSISATSATDGAQLWYTLDGSTPTLGHGTQYSGPISIVRSTTLRMVAVDDGLSDSAVASATYLVMDEVLAQSGTPEGWSAQPINGQVYHYGFDQQYVAEHRAAVADALQAAPTLSITTDVANLIDASTGIYSNPTQSGPAWERPASIELIDGEAGFQINGGIRVKGRFFRDPRNPAHSFRLTFALQYEAALSYPVFGEGGAQTFASLDLRTEQNYGWQSFHQASGSSARNTMMRDQFTRDSQAAVGDSGTRSRWVHLFLNGQYWGMYMLRENITAEHAAQVWGGSKGDYDVIEHANDFGYEVADGDDAEWLEVWAAVSDGHLTDDEFHSVADRVDLANLADFALINICVGNLDSAPSQFLSDFLANNWQAVRGNGQPFRFFLDDAEHTLGALDHNVAVDRTEAFPTFAANPLWTANNFNPGWLHEVLLTRPEYRAIFRERATTLLAPTGALATAASLVRWDESRAQLDPLIEAQAARWGHAGIREFGRPQWEAEVAWVCDVWFAERIEIVREQLRAHHLLGELFVADFPQN